MPLSFSCGLWMAVARGCFWWRHRRLAAWRTAPHAAFLKMPERCILPNLAGVFMKPLPLFFPQFTDEQAKVVYKRPTDLRLKEDVPICCNLLVAPILDEGETSAVVCFAVVCYACCAVLKGWPHCAEHLHLPAMPPHTGRHACVTALFSPDGVFTTNLHLAGLLTSGLIPSMRHSCCVPPIHHH